MRWMWLSLLIAGVSFLGQACVASDAILVQKPSLVCPETELGDGDLQAKYAEIWTNHSGAVANTSNKLLSELAKQNQTATDEGNLNLVLFWTNLENQFKGTGQLKWDEAALKKTWKQNFGNSSFPNQFTIAAAKAVDAYESATKRLENAYTELVVDLTKAKNLALAVKIRDEVQGLLAKKGSAPRPNPQEAAPLSPKEINLLAGLDVAKGRINGQWVKRPNGDLVGSGPAGDGIPRFNFPSQKALDLAAGDYDLTMTFSVRPSQEGFSDIIPILPGVPAVLCFRNEKGGGASKVFFFGGESTGNATTLSFRFQPSRKYTAVISVRNGGARVNVVLDKKPVLTMSNFANKDIQKEFNLTVSPGAELTLSEYVVSLP